MELFKENRIYFLTDGTDVCLASLVNNRYFNHEIIFRISVFQTQDIPFQAECTIIPDY